MTIARPLCSEPMEAAFDGVQRFHECGGLQDRMHEAFVDHVPPDVLPTREPTDRQRACAASFHKWRNACHCDEGGFVCRSCGMHEHYP